MDDIIRKTFQKYRMNVDRDKGGMYKMLGKLSIPIPSFFCTSGGVESIEYEVWQ